MFDTLSASVLNAKHCILIANKIDWLSMYRCKEIFETGN